MDLVPGKKLQHDDGWKIAPKKSGFYESVNASNEARMCAFFRRYEALKPEADCPGEKEIREQDQNWIFHDGYGDGKFHEHVDEYDSG